jgi:hypothetical protein
MKMISSSCSALLIALALAGCGVESGAPLSLPASPALIVFPWQRRLVDPRAAKPLQMESPP